MKLFQVITENYQQNGLLLEFRFSGSASIMLVLKTFYSCNWKSKKMNTLFTNFILKQHIVIKLVAELILSENKILDEF